MTIPRNVFILALGLLAAGTTLAAHADTVTIGSYVGASATGLANSPLTYDNTASGTSGPTTTDGAVAGYYLPGAYAPPFAGTSYVSFNANGGDGYGITYYTTTFSGDASDVGLLHYLVDNDIGIVLNGHTVLAQGETTTYPAFESYNNEVVLPNGDFVSGTNTLVLGVFNSGSVTAVDFTATVASTPEPGSLVLLGTGMLGLAGAARRRFKR